MNHIFMSLETFMNEVLNTELPSNTVFHIFANPADNISVDLMIKLNSLGEKIEIIQSDLNDAQMAFKIGIFVGKHFVTEDTSENIIYIGVLDLDTITKYPTYKKYLTMVEPKPKTVKRVKKTKDLDVVSSTKSKKEEKNMVDVVVKEPVKKNNLAKEVEDGSNKFNNEVKKLIPDITEKDLVKVQTAFMKSSIDVVLDLQMRLALGAKLGDQYTEILKPQFEKLKKYL